MHPSPGLADPSRITGLPLVIERYSPVRKQLWDDFVDQANNATFLFRRDYMDYHRDRFSDYSLMIFRGSDLLALLPANLDAQRTLISHEGLTYGGLVTGSNARLSDILASFHGILLYLEQQEIRRVQYKRIPSLYCSRADDE